MPRCLTLLLIAAFAPVIPAQDAPASPRLGVMIIEDERGVTVDEVVPDSAAQEAGLREGDRILRVGDLKVARDADLRSALARTPQGVPFVITIERGGREIPLKATIGRRALETSARGTPAKGGADAVRGPLQKALDALKDLDGDQAGVAREEIAKALKALDKLPSATSRAGRAGTRWTIAGAKPEDATEGIFSRVRDLSLSGKSPEEIEEEIRKEFPGADVKVAVSNSRAGHEESAPEAKADVTVKSEESSTSVRRMSVRDENGKTVVDCDVRCKACENAAKPCDACAKQAECIKTQKLEELKEKAPAPKAKAERLRPAEKPADRPKPGGG